jgi:hypothetical protein
VLAEVQLLVVGECLRGAGWPRLGVGGGPAAAAARRVARVAIVLVGCAELSFLYCATRTFRSL